MAFLGDHKAVVLREGGIFLIPAGFLQRGLGLLVAGEFYTPRSIVKLMVMLLAPQAGESVYDPACGTGGMLPRDYARRYRC